MTTLSSLVTKLNGLLQPQPLDLDSLVTDIGLNLAKHNLTASIATLGYPAAPPIDLGTPAALSAALNAWTNQDDDAHDTCDSLVACRNPLHPGPCKGWKHTLHSVSPGAWHQLEGERVRKANERRLKRISDLKAQGKPIPRHLLTEIKPKPAPTGTHPAHNAKPVPLGQVNQKADLAGGQAHTAGQSVTNAAGIKPNTAPALPLGPKGKKPTVAGRGPAYVITQPKVTDTYKLGKAEKLTPQEWASLSDADKKTIRDELTAIKSRGFGPQQKKADELLTKLPAPGQSFTPNGTVTTPSGKTYPSLTPTPGKVTLGQAIKQTAPSAPSKTLGTPPTTPPRRPPGVDPVSQVKKAVDPQAQLSPSARSFIYRKLDKQQFDSLDDATKKTIRDDLDKLDAGSASQKQTAQDLRSKFGVPGGSAAPAPAGPVQPSAPLAPGTAPHVQHAVAVANRTAPKASMGKTHVDAYGKLSKADFDALPDDKKRTIRDDLANAKGKFLDPKKQRVAQDLLDRFGSSHSSPAPGAPAVPDGAKGYSDPMNEAVKAASGGGSPDNMLKAVGRLSSSQVGKLDDADRQKIKARLDFTASHKGATPDQRSKAAAYSRVLDGKGPDPKTLKLDHEPSLSELHAHETNTGIANPGGPSVAVSDALKTADSVGAGRRTAMKADERAAAVKSLTSISKADFDKLPADDQNKVTGALQKLHLHEDIRGDLHRDTAVAAHITALTGKHPALHRMEQAEADFRAGKITGDDVYSEMVTAAIQVPGTTDKAARQQLEALNARIAKDNPTLPTYVRVRLAGDPSYSNPAYSLISMAGMKHNWADAPRLNQSDMRALFHADDADLARVDPIHAQAVRDLREHTVATGLAPNSPWSVATRNTLVDVLLDTNRDGEIPKERLDLVNSMPTATRARVETLMRRRLDDQTNVHAKTQTWLALRQLQGQPALSANVRDAVVVAGNRFPASTDIDKFRKLDPADYQALPQYVQTSISEHLVDSQKRVARGGPSQGWSVADNALRVMPAALDAHLKGERPTIADRTVRNATDIAKYGTEIVYPANRVDVYAGLSRTRVDTLTPDAKTAIEIDLDKIARDTSMTPSIRAEALYTKDYKITAAQVITQKYNADQMIAIHATRPTVSQSDQHVVGALTSLSKADFDSLDPVYKDAIDQRILGLSGSDQQLVNAVLHPSTVANTPAGTTPTTAQANVPPHVQAALDTIYGVHPKSHTMAHQLSTYGALRGGDFNALNSQEQSHLLSDLSFIHTTAKGPSGTKAKLLIDRFTPAGTPPGQIPPQPIIPPANSVPGQQRYATPLVGLFKAKDSGQSGDRWITTPGGQRVWGAHGAAGMMIKHVDPATGEERYLMVQRGPAISDPGKWTFPGGAIDSKETPHQGATRETIEELGLKDDQFKDAKVHGDFTYSIPNSTWKYTSVAVEVPAQFQPNLSTAHARAETSDAKWMTIDEIRALDKSGDLHHPIAKGQLEKNVISLYPPVASGPGTKLGQVARPGPVTKRQARLTMPSGGRQAPASFNAWPHAHKPSKGKNLVASKADIDVMRQKVKQDRVKYDGKTADGRLAAIGAMQGFDDTPTVASKSEIDRLLATGDYIEAFRGVSGAGGWSVRSRGGSGGKTAEQINEEMRTGPAYYGKGIFGNGYYLATDKRVATQYADGTKGSVIRMLIPKTAVMKKYDEVEREAQANSSRTSKAKGASYHEISTFWDPGRWGAAKGLDGIEIQPHHRAHMGGGASHVAKPGKPAFNWLNRSVLIIQKEPG